MRSVVRRRVAWMPVKAVGLEFPFCRFFVGAGRARPPPENRQRRQRDVLWYVPGRSSALAGRHRTDLRGPAVRSGTTGGIRALILRPAGEMAVALRLGQFIGNLLQQHQRIGVAGV